MRATTPTPTPTPTRRRIEGALKIARPIYVLETLTLWAFGGAWLIKGGVALRDLPETPE